MSFLLHNQQFQTTEEKNNDTTRLVFMARLRPQFRMPLRFDRCTPPIQSEYPAERRAAAGIAIGTNFKIYFLRQFCSNRVKFFYNTQETQMQKTMDQNFEIRIVIFHFFLKFSKRHRTVPRRPIWTIMVAAKLDHSKVLVTKFRQNRSTLKGRSAGQRHTDRQTNSAEK